MEKSELEKLLRDFASKIDSVQRDEGTILITNDRVTIYRVRGPCCATRRIGDENTADVLLEVIEEYEAERAAVRAKNGYVG